MHNSASFVPSNSGYCSRHGTTAAGGGRPTVKGDECPACSGPHVIGHERPEVREGSLFWSCADCGFTWPRFTSPASSPLVHTSIQAAEEYGAAHSAR